MAPYLVVEVALEEAEELLEKAVLLMVLMEIKKVPTVAQKALVMVEGVEVALEVLG